jgi:putative ABC transport system permease protein
MINIMGLAIGLATCMMIMLYVSYELSYDKFFTNHERIHRIAILATISGDNLDVAVSSNPMGENLMKEYPEVVSFSRIMPNNQAVFFSIDDKSFYNEGLYYVDSSFLNMFSYHMIYGDPATALIEPNSIVLSQTLASKYYADEDPIGQVIKMNDRINLKITGVLKDPPQNSHFDFNCLVSYTTLLEEMGIERFEDWGSLSIYTYIELAENTVPDSLEAKFEDFIYRHMEELAVTGNITFEPYLQEVSSIHLHSNLMAEFGPNSDIGYIYTFAAIAFFALLIACINFMNLATARSARRAREVGMRKVCGAQRKQIIIQFLGESILLAILSMVLALILVELSLPLFNKLTGLELGFTTLFSPMMIIGLVVLLLIVGIFAGSYPAFYMSSFRPIAVIKGNISKSGRSRPHLRNILVVFQFTISIILIICTGIVYMQMEFLQNKRLGFDKENIVVIPLRSDRLRDKIKVFDHEMTNIASVKNVSFSSGLPGSSLNGTGYFPEGGDKDSPWIIYQMDCDFGFVETMGMNLVDGRDFDSSYSTDTNCVIINEALMKRLGWEDPLGKSLMSFGRDTTFPHKILGVIEDFNFKSLHEEVEPAMIMLNTDHSNYMIIRLNPGDPTKAIQEIQAKWEEMELNFIFDYFMFDTQFDELYSSEKAMGRLFIYFAIIAIFIACLGLFGLASYTAEQRTKEIGIRKVLGSSVSNIIIKLTIEFTRWVLLANIIAWPVAWIVMNAWLKNFAYTISWLEYFWILPFATVMSFFIALVTVASQSLRAATTDPVKALKYE